MTRDAEILSRNPSDGDDRKSECQKCRQPVDPTRDFCPHCGETYQQHDGSDPEHRWPY